ncbi:DMT family transporter [Marinicella gelatinilytica]|uniref:DMT family transporter n=1 Tax=Marinicella gelatinilytica TaxID=2996017 RepID=UPI0022609428|nr:SMR family transporter [Marinicella gelatinilytica]MCX7544115.1 SMR family transporter [Marinicella gelatinilytica]
MHWLYLSLAVIGEVIGTSLMKLLVSGGFLLSGILVAVSMIGISYVLLSQATRTIPVALANAFWEGFGMILIGMVSFMILGEKISAIQTAALLMAVFGIIVINYGHYLQEQKS